MAGQYLKVWSEMADVTFCVTFLFLYKIVFLSNNFDYNILETQSRAQKRGILA